MASDAVAAVPARGTKSAGIALALSLIWCGGGQVYNAQFQKGVILALLYATSILLTSANALGFAAMLPLWVYGMADAYRTAGRITREGGAQRLCPHCGESISMEATSCRFCGRAAVVRATT